MKKILNILFYILQLVLFVAAFALTLVVMIQMNRRLEKSFMTTINVFVPFGILLVLLMLNMIFNQKTVRDNILYNITSNLIFATIGIVALRAMFDNHLIISTLNSYHMDFNFFANFLPFLKIMLYGLCISNVLLMFHISQKNTDKGKKRKKSVQNS